MSRAAEQRSTRGLRETYAAAEIPGAEALHGRIVAAIVDAVAQLEGDVAATTLRTGGVELLHTVIEATEIAPVRDHVLDSLRDDLLKVAVAIGRGVLAWEGEFYVDDYLILRINFPYEVARRADPAAENPGVGRLSRDVRDAARARRVVDPVYDPRGYHRGHPPAAWAHGPHVDSWGGHSKDGVNVWWAISDVPAGAGMAMYPAVPSDAVRCDPRTLYVDDGVQLPAPATTALSAGTLLVFDPEMLHGTHLNVTAQTRVALSMRLNGRRPTFDPGCFYAREFWRRASDIDASVERVLRILREDNLAPPCETARAQLPAAFRPPRVVRGVCANGSVRIAARELGRRGRRIVVEAGDRRIVAMRTETGVVAFDAACPHYGVDLSRGGVQNATLTCPGCALAFDLRTGRSAAPSLSLTTYRARERDGTVTVDIASPASA